MKGKYILFLICSLFLYEVSAQTLEQARTLFTKGEYEQAKPVFKKYTKSQPSNGNYNYWYGVCCLKTGEAEEAVKPLEIAVKKRVTSGQLYLGQAYNETYRFEDAVNCFEEYIADKNHNLTAYIKSDKSNEEVESKIEEQILNSGMYCRNICLHFVEDFDEQRLDDDSYLYDLNVSAVRHYVAIMKDNKTFRESYWED